MDVYEIYQQWYDINEAGLGEYDRCYENAFYIFAQKLLDAYVNSVGQAWCNIDTNKTLEEAIETAVLALTHS